MKNIAEATRRSFLGKIGGLMTASMIISPDSLLAEVKSAQKKKMAISDEAFKKALASDAVLVAAMAKAIYEKYGDEGLAILARGLEQALTPEAQAWGKELGVPLGKGQIDDWVKLDGFPALMLGMEYEFTTVSPSSAYIRVTQCPFADSIRRIFPDYCRKVLIGVERAIVHVVNPNMEVHGEKYLTEGDSFCEIHCDLKR